MPARAPPIRHSLRRAACAVAAVAALLALYAGWRGDLGRLGSPVSPLPAPPLALRDDLGHPFDPATLRGRATLVYFGYVRCPDVCPTVLEALGPVFARLGPDAARTRVLFVTLDPAHDTPTVLHGFLAHFQPTPTGLTGPPAELARTAHAWGIGWTGSDGRISHTSVLTLVGPDGRTHARYGMTQLGDPAAMAAEIRAVLSS
ncbi:SCO family protein [Gluconacetobacter sacchari]|uniref:SCO family protein n=1 Tax=Gluconacetobacter sacchari TaxID=92759 RepID=UPI0039B55644